MARNKVSIYLWLIDTIMRYGTITRSRLNELWMQSPLSDGKPLPRRTFFNYKEEAEQMFDVDIKYSRATFEYYIEGDPSKTNMQRWLLDSMSLSNTMSSATDLSSRIMLENVPSSREHLPSIIEAMRGNLRIKFDYKSYQRSQPNLGVVLEPYFVKIFKQLWYVIGFHVQDRRVKTYSLDRMSNLTITSERFAMPDDFVPADFFANYFGVTTNRDEPKRIVLRVSATQAKYLRALPLHSSQREEEVHDKYSIFSLTVHNTYDLREAILSYGSNVEVLAPQELRLQIKDTLQQALNQYN